MLPREYTKSWPVFRRERLAFGRLLLLAGLAGLTDFSGLLHARVAGEKVGVTKGLPEDFGVDFG